MKNILKSEEYDIIAPKFKLACNVATLIIKNKR